MLPELVPVVAFIQLPVKFKNIKHPLFATLLIIIDDRIQDFNCGKTFDILNHQSRVSFIE
jgi:hypothetical protein